VTTTEKFSGVYITEASGKNTAAAGDVQHLTADNGTSKDPADYEWSSSYGTSASVDSAGVVTVTGSSSFAIYAKDKKTGVTGVYWVNSEYENETAPATDTGTTPDPEINASEWATSELEEAAELGLIPEVLQGADLTQSITRAEFAAVAVKVFENLTATKAIPAIVDPFTDTDDTEVLKAYNANIMVGTSATAFSPDVLLNREQCATALTRVFKRVTIPGWTYATDAEYTLDYIKPAPFADDDKISSWAKDSVYFMAANEIILGTGNNMFSPRAITSEEQAKNYASATREQAIVIALRMVKTLGA